MISPVDRPIDGNAMGTKSLLGTTEIGLADFKSMVSFTQRILNMISDSRRKVSSCEQCQHLRTAAQQYLVMTKTLSHFQA